MVHGLAAQSGGALQLSSEVGRGTRADVWIPEARKEAMQKSVKAIEQPTATGRYSILVVDDDLLVAMGTTAMLEDLGHSVVMAQSGKEALEKLEKGGFELVLTDHAMPGMTGLELARHIRERFPEIPVILASGYAETPGDCGDRFPRLAKPFSDEEIARAISIHAPRRGAA
jgi:CheY-like chemotaxis protein